MAPHAELGVPERCRSHKHSYKAIKQWRESSPTVVRVILVDITLLRLVRLYGITFSVILMLIVCDLTSGHAWLPYCTHCAPTEMTLPNNYKRKAQFFFTRTYGITLCLTV